MGLEADIIRDIQAMQTALEDLPMVPRTPYVVVSPRTYTRYCVFSAGWTYREELQAEETLALVDRIRATGRRNVAEPTFEELDEARRTGRPCRLLVTERDLEQEERFRALIEQSDGTSWSNL